VITLSSAQNQDDSDPSRPVIPPTGAITLFSPAGSPVGVLHASTLTAFRTALASSCLLIRRRSVRTLTVFGCGLQAYWHIRVALMMRGSAVKHVNIINRRFSDRCMALLRRFHRMPAATRDREGWKATTFSVLTPGYGDYVRLLREQVLQADVIFCCTPSTEPLFDASALTSREGRQKGRLIVAIGSYTPAMRELPVELLRQATGAREKGQRHFHKHAPEGGAVVVDTLDGALQEAGEIIEAGLAPNQLVEYVGRPLSPPRPKR
jgi:ornithine cyclodeaminase/alanine dehydrogenase-like protein (mu-crystallin family)